MELLKEKQKSYSKDQNDDAIEAMLIVVKIVVATVILAGSIMAFTF